MTSSQCWIYIRRDCMSIESQGDMAACYGSMLMVSVSQPCCLLNLFFFPSVDMGKKVSQPSRLPALSPFLAFSAAAGTSAAVAATAATAARVDHAKQDACNGMAGGKPGRATRKKRRRQEAQRSTAHNSMQQQTSQPKLAIEEEERTILVFKE
jgi:hypothetical protein